MNKATHSIAGVLGILFTGAGVAVIIYGLSLLPAGYRDVGEIENIDGIPYPEVAGYHVISEKLAHADIYLREPVAFKQILITVEFDPGQLEQLDIGVRENSFWLSYPKHTLYDAALDSSGRQRRTVSIPLTNKLQEANRSIDVMFFATSSTSTAGEDEGIDDPTYWELYDITVQTERVIPSGAELKDYLRSILKQERAL